ncbi:SEC-C metal-binding domain-containing protein [Sphingomonadaceae bacterium G21617-S1]|nr:SEC-C metal-binding domain-containing protein [Sphingomonadaceae bacterium G21617-S1]
MLDYTRLDSGRCQSRYSTGCVLSRFRHSDRRRQWQTIVIRSTSLAFERTSKRRKGYPSETNVKRGLRFVHGDKELIEKLGRNDPCPCGSGLRFQTLLPDLGLLLTALSATTIGVTDMIGAGMCQPLPIGSKRPTAVISNVLPNPGAVITGIGKATRSQRRNVTLPRWRRPFP